MSDEVKYPLAVAGQKLSRGEGLSDEELDGLLSTYRRMLDDLHQLRDPDFKLMQTAICYRVSILESMQRCRELWRKDGIVSSSERVQPDAKS